MWSSVPGEPVGSLCLRAPVQEQISIAAVLPFAPLPEQFASQRGGSFFDEVTLKFRQSAKKMKDQLTAT